MREIKFRAWHKAHEKMFDVLGLYPSLGRVQLKGQNNAVPLGVVDLMQFTGLRDEKGQMIYEGDILTAIFYPFQVANGAYNYHAVVCWLDANAQFGYEMKLANKKARGISDGVYDSFEADDDGRVEFEVIGNVHQHPHLLGGAAND